MSFRRRRSRGAQLLIDIIVIAFLIAAVLLAGKYFSQ